METRGAGGLPEVRTFNEYAEERYAEAQRAAEAASSAAGAGFRIDPDVAETAAQRLEGAADRVDELRWDARWLQDVPSPGEDAVSRNAAVQLGEMAGETGGFQRAMTAYRDALRQTAQQMRGQAATYREVEGGNAAGMGTQ